MASERDYDTLVSRAAREIAPLADASQRRARVIDLLWDALGWRSGDARDNPGRVSWIGFYLHDPAGVEGQELVLGARRDKPACSPIGLHGCCGRCFVSQRPLVVRDVRVMGPNYIACDPRDQSEVVLPCFERVGDALRCWGVLDADSYDVGAFDARDATGLEQVLIAARVSERSHAALEIL
ncbi:MAG: hypothetical protein SFZ23_12045 [Planctomycetota bacterium]|nr:hypothetical protein [Planctomycetota bacterium]